MTSYEWILETHVASDTRDDDEPADVASFATLAELIAYRDSLTPSDARYVVALERTSDDGRAWAYVADGVLQTAMSDAFDAVICRVPARFMTEFANHWERIECRKSSPDTSCIS